MAKTVQVWLGQDTRTITYTNLPPSTPLPSPLPSISPSLLCPLSSLSHPRFLGKVLSQYLSVLVREGMEEEQLVMEGFDYQRWRKTFEKLLREGKV